MTEEDIVSTLTRAFGAGVTEGWTITFTQPTERLSLNDRGHWGRRHRIGGHWAAAVYFAACRDLGVSPASRARPPCFVLVTFPVTTNRRRDSDNPATTTKVIVDSLVKASVWPDDDPAHVETLPSRFERRPDRLVTVQLIPRADGAR